MNECVMKLMLLSVDVVMKCVVIEVNVCDVNVV